MKKYLIIAITSLLAFSAAKAQEYKVKPAGKLVINLSSVIVEGYNGNEIIFSSKRKEEPEDERAKGLSLVNGAGFTDNTGLGISVTEGKQACNCYN